MKTNKFSVIGVLKLYENLVKSYDTFSKTDDFYQQYKNLKGENAWKQLFEEFKTMVHSTFHFIFVQENPKYQLVHLQFMHARVIKSITKGTDSRRVVRKYMYTNPHKNQAMTFCIKTGQIVHQFTKKPTAFGYDELFSLLTILNQEVHQYRNSKKPVLFKFQQIPIGVQVQLRYFHGEWCFATRSIARANEATFIGKCTLENKLKQLLESYQLSLNDLSKDCLYTFVLSSQEYTFLEQQDQLYLLSIFDLTTHSSKREDILKTSKLPKLKTEIVSISELFKEHQFTKEALKNRLMKMLNDFDNLTCSVTIKTLKGYYQIDSEIFELVKDVIGDDQTLSREQQQHEFRLKLEDKTNQNGYLTYFRSKVELQ